MEKNKKIILTIVVLLVIAAVAVLIFVMANPKENKIKSKYDKFEWSTKKEAKLSPTKITLDSDSNLKIENEDEKVIIKKLPNNEKIKYFEEVSSPQVPMIMYVVALSTEGNLYYIDIEEDITTKKINTDNKKVLEMVRDIDTKTQIEYTKNNIYVLLEDGRLLKVFEGYDEDKQEFDLKLGVSYEEANSYKTTLQLYVQGKGFYVTEDNYLKNSDVTRSYLLDEEGNKIKVKYSFQEYSDSVCYFITDNNKLYKLDLENFEITLVNDKIVKKVTKDGETIIVEATDGTTEELTLIPENSEITYAAYGDKTYDFTNKQDRVKYVEEVLFREF